MYITKQKISSIKFLEGEKKIRKNTITKLKTIPHKTYKDRSRAYL